MRELGRRLSKRLITNFMLDNQTMNTEIKETALLLAIMTQQPVNIRSYGDREHLETNECFRVGSFCEVVATWYPVLDIEEFE